MSVKDIRGWLSQFKTLKPSEFQEYAEKSGNFQNVFLALTSLFEDNLTSEYMEPACHQLFEFFNSPLDQLRQFTLELVPVLLEVYLQAVARGERKKCSGIEALFLGIYNLEIVDSNGKAKLEEFSIPTLATPSVYHEPPSLASMVLTETALLKHNSDGPVVVQIGPYPPVERLIDANQQSVLSYILRVYNREIGSLSSNSRLRMMKTSARLCKQGFPTQKGWTSGSVSTIGHRKGHGRDQTPQSSLDFTKKKNNNLEDPRIPLSAGLMLEMLTAVYFSMFNDHARMGLDAVEHIHRRASYEMYPDVKLVTNAIQNTFKMPSSQSGDGPMGVNVSLTPNQANPAFRRNAITNASFRANRLPEDIDIVQTPEVDNPSSYEDVNDAHSSDKSRFSAIPKPLKSIIRNRSGEKAGKSEASSKSRKSAELGETLSLHSVPPPSPAHSHVTDGSAIDPAQVTVEFQPDAEVHSQKSQHSEQLGMEVNGISSGNVANESSPKVKVRTVGTILEESSQKESGSEKKPTTETTPL